MLTNKTRVRDGRGRPRKNTLKARKAPGQARSQETVGVILEASARILESDGLRGFNTNAIAAKAGVSVGSLYQYFPNKDSIVLALIDSFEKEFHDTGVKAVQDGKGRGLKSRLRLVVRALVSAHYCRPRLNRVLETEEERLGSEADDSAFHTNLLQLLRDHKKEIGNACFASNGTGFHGYTPRRSRSRPCLRRESTIHRTASYARYMRIPALFRLKAVIIDQV